MKGSLSRKSEGHGQRTHESLGRAGAECSRETPGGQALLRPHQPSGDCPRQQSAPGDEESVPQPVPPPGLTISASSPGLITGGLITSLCHSDTSSHLSPLLVNVS